MRLYGLRKKGSLGALACRVVHGRKLELEYFLKQRSVDICLLSETFLNPSQAFQLANYVCHRTD
jgi:hypothetical protein